MPRREYHSSCVCPPGRAPGGNTRHGRVHCVSSCFSSLLVLGLKFVYGWAPFFTDLSVCTVNHGVERYGWYIKRARTFFLWFTFFKYGEYSYRWFRFYQKMRMVKKMSDFFEFSGILTVPNLRESLDNAWSYVYHERNTWCDLKCCSSQNVIYFQVHPLMIVYQKLLNQIYKLHVIMTVWPLEVRIGNSIIPKAFILCLSDLPTPTVFIWEEVGTLVIVVGMNNFSCNRYWSMQKSMQKLEQMVKFYGE